MVLPSETGTANPFVPPYWKFVTQAVRTNCDGGADREARLQKSCARGAAAPGNPICLEIYILEAEELPPCAKLLIDATRRAGPEHRSLYRTHQMVRNASTHETVNVHSTSDHLPLLQHRGACSDCTQDGEDRWNTGAEQLLAPPVRVEAFEPEVRWGGLVHAMDEMLTPYLDRVSKLGGIVRKDVYWPAAELMERERWCGSVLRVKLYDGHV